MGFVFPEGIFVVGKVASISRLGVCVVRTTITTQTRMIAPGNIPSCGQWGTDMFSFGNLDVDGFVLPLRAIV